MKKLLIIYLILFIACDVTGISGTNDKDTGKKVVLMLDPGPGNPRNSEGDFIALKDGRIMFVYTHYTGSSGSDHGSAYLAARYSENNGKTWTRESEKIIEQEGKLNIMSVSLLRLQNGEIIYCNTLHTKSRFTWPLCREPKGRDRSGCYPYHKS